MRIGILYDDRGSRGLDLSHPEDGNPGVSGTQFCFLMLMRYYHLCFPENELIVYHTADNQNRFPACGRVKLVHTIENIPKEAALDKVDLLVFGHGLITEMDEGIKTYKVKSVVWAHNFLPYNFLKRCHSNQYIVRIVFVGKEQYERYIDDPIIERSVYIFNMYNADNDEFKHRVCNKPIVTYTGSLIKSKGFHVLAKEWKTILKEVPNAELYVIGSGQLYNRQTSLGKYGISNEEYEKEFMPYLVDNNERILPSVHFMGLMGREKIDIYNKTTVGVVNPTARTEICSISTIEMEACGIPVVSKNKNGMPDVIENGKTGFLFNTRSEFRKAIIDLLTDRILNEGLSKNAIIYVKNKFSPDIIVKQWDQLFKDAISGEPCIYKKPTDNWGNNYKWARQISRVIEKPRRVLHIPSLAVTEMYLRFEVVKRIIRH